MHHSILSHNIFAGYFQQIFSLPTFLTLDIALIVTGGVHKDTVNEIIDQELEKQGKLQKKEKQDSGLDFLNSPQMGQFNTILSVVNTLNKSSGMQSIQSGLNFFGKVKWVS